MVFHVVLRTGSPRDGRCAGWTGRHAGSRESFRRRRFALFWIL